MLAYRHGFRVSELVALRWEQIDFKAGSMHVNRLKSGLASTHPIRGVQQRALRALRKDYPDSPYVFVTERDGPLTPATVREFITRAGELAKLPFDARFSLGAPVWPGFAQLLRCHGTGIGIGPRRCFDLCRCHRAHGHLGDDNGRPSVA